MSSTTAAAAAKLKSITAVAVSVGVTSGVIVHAFRQKKQFYPSVVYLSKSNPSMAVIYVQALVMVYLFGKLAGKIFFGTLRAAETERLIEKAWYAVTETCLAFTIFKDDLSPKFVALFTLLLFLKCFHWLAEDRVDYMERTPIISYLFHIRIWFLLSLLTMADIFFVHDAYTTTITKGPSVQLVFGFEYALLITLALNAAIKYILHALDVHSDTFWENKAVLLLYLEFFIGFCKAVMYVIFLAIMIRTYTIPLFAFRPMYHTLRNFKKVFQDLVLSRKAIHNMNTLYPDATAEDFQSTENVCIICREDMNDTAAKKLPCNHIFHTSCLRSWFQRHQTCPTCRLDILRSTPSASRNNPATPPPRPATTDPSAAAASGSTATANAADQNNTASSSSQSANSVPESNTQNYEHLLRSFLTNAGTNMSSEDIGRQRQNEFLASFANHTSGAEINSSNQTSSGFVPPFNPLHMPFIGAAAIQPPPMPDDLSALSDEELRIMEGNTREACLARLKYVTDIKTMLDSAVIMMNHYSSACLIAGINNVPSTSSNVQNQEQESSKQDSPTECCASSSSNNGGETSSSAVDSKNNENEEEPQEETEQQRIIRLKRLEKFSNPTS